MKYLIKKTPDSFIKSVNEEINSILSRSFDSLFPEFIFSEELNKLSMPVEIKEKDKEYLIKAELPGVKKEDLEIDLNKSYARISAKKEEKKEEQGKNFRKSEFKYGDFSRVIYFPLEIDVDNSEAKLEHGILTINVPKIVTEKEEVKKLQVK